MPSCYVAWDESSFPPKLWFKGKQATPTLGRVTVVSECVAATIEKTYEKYMPIIGPPNFHNPQLSHYYSQSLTHEGGRSRCFSPSTHISTSRTYKTSPHPPPSPNPPPPVLQLKITTFQLPPSQQAVKKTLNAVCAGGRNKHTTQHPMKIG
jgi:hypothetical protein